MQVIGAEKRNRSVIIGLYPSISLISAVVGRYVRS